MSDLKLYQITDDFQELMDRATDGEITEEEYNKLGEKLAMQLQEKSTNIIGYYETQNNLVEGIDSQIKRLQNLKKVTKNRIDRYKEYVKGCMEKLGLVKIETELGTISVAKSPISVEVVDENKIPKKFKEEVKTIKIDKTKIKNSYKETGELPEGTIIHDNNTYLKIK